MRRHLKAWKKAYERTIFCEPLLRSLLARVATPNDSKNAYYAMAMADQWISNPQEFRPSVRTWESLLTEGK
jgi:hypothetical protein